MNQYRVFVLDQSNMSVALHDCTCIKAESAIDVAQMLFSGRFPPDRFKYIAQKQVPPKKRKKK